MATQAHVLSLTHRHGEWPVVIAFVPKNGPKGEELERTPWYPEAVARLESAYYARGEKTFALEEAMPVLLSAYAEWLETKQLADALAYEPERDHSLDTWDGKTWGINPALHPDGFGGSDYP